MDNPSERALRSRWRRYGISQPLEAEDNHALAVPGIAWAEKLVIAWGIIKQPGGGTEQVEIIGYDPETGIGGPWNMRQGRTDFVKNGNFIIVDESAEKRLGHFAIGDYRDVLHHRLRIVGISEGVKSFTTAPFVFTSYKLAQNLVGYVGPDNTVFIVAKVAPGFDIEQVVSSLQTRLTGVDVYTRQAFSRKTRLYWTIETAILFRG